MGAIEETLRRHCDVSDAAVVAETVDETNKRLVAYVVRGPQATWKVDVRSGTSRDLRTLLERHLPFYTVPSHFMELEALPINQQTGKLERKALPPLRKREPVVRRRTGMSKHSTAAERRNALRELWAEALDVDSDTLKDDWNFFDLGGHSLTGLGLTLGIEQMFGIELSGTEIYEYPTIGELASFLEHRGLILESRISLAEDSVLDPEISPRSKARSTRLSEASTVLVTGTTGFLGAFLLDQLLRTTDQDTRFFCLVRDRDSGEGKPSNRVLETLNFYGLASQSASDRIIPVLGDLTRPQMGLDNEQYQELAEKNRPDIPLCRLRQLYLPLRRSQAPHRRRHIGGAQVRLQRYDKAGPIHFIQRYLPGGDNAPYLENNQTDDFVDRMEGGYNQAKWVAERLVWSAVSRGLPVCIFRPGNIGHHSRTGTANPNDFLSLIIKACARLGCAPQAADWFFEMTPVDFLVAAITKISDDAKHLGKVYNVVQQDPVPANQVFARMESHGYITDSIPLGEWKSRLEAAADREDDMELKVLVRSLDSVEPYLADTSVYDISQFAKALTEIDLTMPTVDVEYVTKFLEK